MYRVVYREKITSEWIDSAEFTCQKDALAFKRMLPAKYKIKFVQWKDVNGKWVG